MRAARTCVAALAFVACVAVGIPAQAQTAAPPLSRASAPVGAALVRIEALNVTVAPTPEHAYVLTFTSAITVSWMGEVAKAPGKAKRQLAVGHLSAKDLGRRWAKLGLARQGKSRATLTWNSSSASPGFSVVSLQRPRVDSAGQVTINLTSTEALPADLTDVTLNIDRAIEKKARASKFPEHFTYQLTANLQANTTAYSGLNAGITLYSGTSCFQLTLIQQAPQMTLPSGLSCGGIVFTNGLASLSIASQTMPASVLFSSTMAPPGQSSFTFSSVISSWPVMG